MLLFRKKREAQPRVVICSYNDPYSPTGFAVLNLISRFRKLSDMAKQTIYKTTTIARAKAAVSKARADKAAKKKASRKAGSSNDRASSLLPKA